MNVLPISSIQPQFKAKIANTKEYSELLGYLNKYVNASAGWYNSKKDLKLVESVSGALESFPTDAELKFSIMYRKGELFNARGVVESQYAKLTDTEPARSDSVVPIPNIMKRILNPENNAQFNALMGNKDNNIWAEWWNKHIEPIWGEIKNNFYEPTVYKKNAHPDFDFMFRRSNEI